MLQLIVAASLTIGAADDNATKIVGTWTAMVEEKGEKIGITVEFSKDGKFKSTITSEKGTVVKMSNGTYTIDKDQLTIVQKDIARNEKNTIKELTKDTLVLVIDEAKIEFKFTKKK